MVAVRKDRNMPPRRRWGRRDAENGNLDEGASDYD
jgi:hypothetical protein